MSDVTAFGQECIGQRSPWPRRMGQANRSLQGTDVGFDMPTWQDCKASWFGAQLWTA